MIILDNFFLLSPLHDFHVYTLDADEQLRMHNMKILFSFIHKHMFFLSAFAMRGRAMLDMRE